MRETIDVNMLGGLYAVDDMSDEEVLKREEFYRGGNPSRQHPYDGVVGILPGWLDDNYQLSFKHAQKVLLAGENWKGNTPEQVLELMDTYCRLRNDSEFKFTKDLFPNASIRSLEYLVHCRDMVLLGKTDALRLVRMMLNLSTAAIFYRAHSPYDMVFKVYRPIELLNKYDEAGVKDFHSPFWKEILLITENQWLLAGEPSID